MSFPSSSEQHGDPTQRRDLREALRENVAIAGGVRDILAGGHKAGVLVGQGLQRCRLRAPAVSWGFLVASLLPTFMLDVSLLNGQGVVLGEGALAIHHEQRRLAPAPVGHHHALWLLPAWAWGGSQG